MEDDEAPADDEVAEEQQVGGAGERGETAAVLSEAAVDGRSVEDHAASALDASDEWGGAEAWPAPAEHEDVEVIEEKHGGALQRDDVGLAGPSVVGAPRQRAGGQRRGGAVGA